MIEKFEIRIQTFDIVGGIHYYGKIEIPMTRRTAENLERQIELNHVDNEHQPSWWHKDDGDWTTIKFFTIREVIVAAKKWFLTDPRVKPGDKLVIWKEYWRDQDVKL